MYSAFGDDLGGARAVTDYFFIVGAPKAGTTWLAESLTTHRRVHLSPVKEPHFFAPPVRGELNADAVTDENLWQVLSQRDRVHNGWIRDPTNYERLLTPSPGKTIAGEATVAYLHAPMAAKRIARRFPYAKIIAILREPISRALSHISMDRVTGLARRMPSDIIAMELDLAFRKGSDETKYLSRSLYATALERYAEYFTRDRILMIRFDDIKTSPDSVAANVSNFLGISPDEYRPATERRNKSEEARWQMLNELLIDTGIKSIVRRSAPRSFIKFGKRFFYRAPKYDVLSPELIRRLREYFEPDICRTEAISGLDLSAWRKIHPLTDGKDQHTALLQRVPD